MSCCFRPNRPKTNPPMNTFSYEAAPVQEPKNIRQEVILRIPGCTVHLMDEGEALELARGEFTLVRILEDNVPLATIVKVGYDLQWPLTKDEPVVKLDSHQYLFSLLVQDGESLSYGVTFWEQYSSSLGMLDSFLKENSCFSASEIRRNVNKDVDWKEFAPKVEDYNSFLAKAIAGGTGQIVKGIFQCSNAYTNQVQKGGEIILTRATEKNGVSTRESSSNGNAVSTNKSGLNKSLKRVRKLSKMTEKLSKRMLDIVGVASGTAMAPVVKSQAGKAFLSMVPGEVILASLDAVNKVLDAAEAAERQALSATSRAASRTVSKRFGESAGEATEDAFATAGHCASTAWNIFKVRKAINPASSVSSGVLKNAASISSQKY
ncbi:Senescence domain-containing protein [Cephalotus follicularis]|uniref:Senescence domain-containing protein n=1 Tax=Cephalotus follicularis TaxID=3775 RepID=A0A1Q3D8P3_CEPFO|nr:Senescence domain-containing protein [Cephalotus follicularis]